MYWMINLHQTCFHSFKCGHLPWQRCDTDCEPILMMNLILPSVATGILIKLPTLRKSQVIMWFSNFSKKNLAQSYVTIKLNCEWRSFAFLHAKPRLGLARLQVLLVLMLNIYLYNLWLVQYQSHYISPHFIRVCLVLREHLEENLFLGR
jgi:hypothetical protein